MKNYNNHFFLVCTVYNNNKEKVIWRDDMSCLNYKKKTVDLFEKFISSIFSFDVCAFVYFE